MFAEGRLLEGGHLIDANSKSFPFNELQLSNVSFVCSNIIVQARTVILLYT